MSVSGISSSNLFDSNQSVQNNMQKFRQEFQQLGQDLQSGNLSAAQSDFATLPQLSPQNLSHLPRLTSRGRPAISLQGSTTKALWQALGSLPTDQTWASCAFRTAAYVPRS